MEFNPDGSLKLPGQPKEKKHKAVIEISQLTDNQGLHILIKLVDTDLPYNLIEGHFHQIEGSQDTEATLSKKNDTEYDVVVKGPEANTWKDSFIAALSDFLDDQLEVVQ